ncbi:hypothetical protein BBH51_01160 [Aggregatibacter actinomycetemcomitans]|uniref:hypothetical protein n=1 Tax=Aggregatibacter actinomycetemcomitans TaxID=714 RepID=UPI0002A3574B|nr:hypothetical protein [Aggregatibacter actinomycetemcomitans]ANU81370.1 hypothetical protein BBH51_01160 [Aggregatibacter actinomycetemcomitans]EKX96477.1 hypothetical protein HMPREF9996_01231 [Aggregatibacter actinomycetemcomitans Y4]KND83112.1 hypothetical protein H5P1_0210095 [Aggregatibacter actinomycetemcomitans serotype a str. H5P1]KOE30920.1 hypothetical protein D17P3_0307820 [Aggregatibacter actinomycetemcomitans D17P-3]KOE64743.1 hypothetical protein I63B_0308535 [Aggregatibacter ac
MKNAGKNWIAYKINPIVSSQQRSLSLFLVIDKASWENCVGKGNYFVVNDENQLSKAFKQIIGFEEEVGRSSSVTPGLFK